MASFDIATGYVKFKGNLDEFDQDIAKANKKLKDMQESAGIGSNRLRMGATESARIAREMAIAAKESRKIMDLVTLGKFGVMVRDLKVSLNNFAAGAARFGAGATAIGGAALASGASGSPLAQSTLEGSFKLLATTIGGTFTPLVKDASRGLQQLAKTWNGISASTKNMISEGAKFIGLSGLLALGLAAVAKGFSALLAHPFIAAMTGGIMAGSVINNAINARDNSRFGEGQKNIAGINVDEVAGDARTANMKAMGAAGIELARKEWSSRKAEYEAAAADSNSFQTNAFDLRRTASPLSGGWRIDDANKAQAEWKKSEIRWAAVAGDDEKLKAARKGGGGGAGAKDDMLLGSMGPASMVGVADMFKSFQLAGASNNQLEAEIKKKEMENAQALVDNSFEQTKLLKKIADNPPVSRQ